MGILDKLSEYLGKILGSRNINFDNPNTVPKNPFTRTYNFPSAQPTAAPSPTPTPTPTQIPTPTPTLNPKTPDDYAGLINSAASQYGIPAYQFSNLLNKESMGFSPNVISGKLNSPKGAMGIAQFMPDTAKWWAKTHGEFDPLIPEQAIPAAAHFLAYLNKQFNDLPSTYAAYNWGEGNVKNALSQYGDFQKALPYFPEETRNYVPAVMSQGYPY